MRLRRGLPLVLLTILAVGLPILEVYLLIRVGQAVGLLPTIILLVVIAALGGWLMRHQGARAWQALTDAYTKGRVPTGHLADAVLILVGGLLLILPGFLTDAIGFVFVLPWTRPYARKMIAFFVARRISKRAARQRDRAGVITGETVDTRTAPRKRPTKAPRPDAGPAVIEGEVKDPPAPPERAG
jgi:UPF0716 protein FxsA